MDRVVELMLDTFDRLTLLSLRCQLKIAEFYVWYFDYLVSRVTLVDPTHPDLAEFIGERMHAVERRDYLMGEIKWRTR